MPITTVDTNPQNLIRLRIKYRVGGLTLQLASHPVILICGAEV
jgi:hypothetical protein